MRFNLLLALIGLLASAGSAFAQVPGKPDPASVQAGTYRIDPDHTQVLFSVSHMGFSIYSGMFSGASGILTLDPSHLDATKLDVTVPVQSVATTSPKLTGELKGADWLDGGNFPEMRFEATGVTEDAADHAKVEGNLTLHGVTHPLTLDVKFVGAGTNPMHKTFMVGFEANGTVKRSDYGVTKYVPLISDEVRLTIAGAFERQP